MHKLRLRARYRRIMAFFTRAALHFIFWDILLMKVGLRGLSRRTRPERYARLARQFRALAIRLGGVMIKVGQFLSSRLDVLPVEITDELAGLQDEVPAEDFRAIRELAEVELGGALEALFDTFEPAPLAAASLGQVHRARLKEDSPRAGVFREVVVKVQRPFIEQVIEIDLKALRRVGGWLKRYKPVSRRVDVPALLEEFTGTIHAEIDYLAEGRNAEIFADNFKGNERIHVPRVVWEHTTVKVLTLENVLAIKITDYEAITAAGIDRAEVASVLLDTYLQQIFDDAFFHADPHPGNLFITPAAQGGPDGWRLTFVDFGMVGSVPDELRDGLREALIAVGTRDAARVVRAYQTMGVLLPGADLRLIEQAEARAFDEFWGKSMSELRRISHAEMMRFALEFRELMYSMPFQLPHNLLLLGRTMAILSGMCTGLHPDFNVWAELSPYAEKLVAQEVGSGWQTWLDELGSLLQALVALPGQAGRVLARVERGELQILAPQVQTRLERIDRSVNKTTGGLVFIGLVVAGAILYSGGDQTTGWVFFGTSAAVLLWILFAPVRR